MFNNLYLLMFLNYFLLFLNFKLKMSPWYLLPFLAFLLVPILHKKADMRGILKGAIGISVGGLMLSVLGGSFLPILRTIDFTLIGSCFVSILLVWLFIERRIF